MIPLTLPIDDTAAARSARNAVHALNFFVAAMQTGFGQFVSVWLVSQGWSLTDAGGALSVGTAAALCAQLPGGAVVDRMHRKRPITIAALAVVALSALMIALTTSVPAIWMAEVLHSAGSAIITPAIAALTLALCGHESFSERLGDNARYASIGTMLAAGSYAVVATPLGEQSIFLITAALALPAVATLYVLKSAPVLNDAVAADPVTSDHMANVPPRHRDTAPWTIFSDPVMHIFALCVVLFQLSNAAVLWLSLSELSRRGEASGFVVSAAIIVPQLVVAACSPWAGRMARTLGRRKVLLIGFVALPVRALLFAANPGPELVDVIQVLDGVSATVVGLMLPLIASDLTKKTGHMNLAIGSFGLAAGLGATFSTTAAGWVADRMGAEMAFLGLALVAGAALLLLFFAMPETRPVDETREVNAAA